MHGAVKNSYLLITLHTWIRLNRACTHQGGFCTETSALSYIFLDKCTVELVETHSPSANSTKQAIAGANSGLGNYTERSMEPQISGFETRQGRSISGSLLLLLQRSRMVDKYQWNRGHYVEVRQNFLFSATQSIGFRRVKIDLVNGHWPQR